MAAFGLLGETARGEEAQLVWKPSDWKLAAFHKLASDPAHVKQVYDIVQIGGGKFLNNIKNSLNGLHYVFGVPEKDIRIAAAMHGPANMLNFDDTIWGKYQIGAWLKVTDPATGKPAERNLFYKSKSGLKNEPASANPDDRKSFYQDTSMEALQARGVQFLCCHTAMEEQARILVERNKLSQTPEEVVQEMLAHTMPGVLVVAAMVAAIALLQTNGHYSYITV
jgi:intracellular sulfur oxidation DsrE/DsrF family protein